MAQYNRLPVQSKLAMKHRLSFEIMRLTFRLQQLIAQAPGGVKCNMTAANRNLYNQLEGQNDDMTRELFRLMDSDSDI